MKLIKFGLKLLKLYKTLLNFSPFFWLSECETCKSWKRFVIKWYFYAKDAIGTYVHAPYHETTVITRLCVLSCNQYYALSRLPG